MKKLLALLSLFISIISFGQLENANWCFALNTGVSFLPSPAGISSQISNGNPGSSMTCASVSDASGQLLFYTDGINVWNGGNNTIMTNGTGLYGGNVPHAQNVVIAPKPSNPGIYYIFSFSYPKTKGFANPPGRGGFHYSVVDMTLGPSNGIVTFKNISMNNEFGAPIDYAFTSQGGTNQLAMGTKMTTTLHHDQNGIWVVAFLRFNNTCNLSQVTRYAYSYLIRPGGISGVPDGTSPGPTNTNPFALDNLNYYQNSCFLPGVMKISPDGHWLADAEAHMNLYSFNDQTGAVAFNNTIYTAFSHPGGGAGIGTEFSPNSGLLYFSLYNIDEVIQYEIATGQSTTISVPVPAGMQLAIDNKLYLIAGGNLQYTDWLSVIPNPNVQGSGCGFVGQSVSLSPNTHAYTLPQWIHKTQTVIPPTGPWVWMHGDNTPDQPGSYGTMGVSSPTNKPSARYDAATWTDNNNVFWMFGGAKSPTEMYNDLWKYENGGWVWVRGTNLVSQTGIYGTLGVPDGTSQPGARCAASTWFQTDASGRYIWLYGGWTSTGGNPPLDKHNDLWKFNLDTKEWTWVSGSSSLNQYAVYGTKNVPSPSNRPGAKGGHSSWIIDNSGNSDYLYMFGGDGLSTMYGGLQNDLWRFSVSSGQWTWVHGEDNTINPSTILGVYQTYQSEDPANRPGSRGGSITWTDGTNLWLFSGIGAGASTYGHLNDLWVFNANSGNWMWVGGSSSVDQYGTYGTQGTASVNNIPGGRSHSISWKTNDGKFWLLGGFGFSQTSSGEHNDLWKFNPSTYEWTWVDGSNTSTAAPSHGTLQVPALTNNPGGRSRASAWVNSSNNVLWLFGGVRYASPAGNYNDLWKYTGACSANCRQGAQTQVQTPVTVVPLNTIKLAVNPNPVRAALSLSILKNDKRSFAVYAASIADQSGNIVWRNDKFTGNTIDVSSLKTGIYFITVIGEKGEKGSTVFFKL